MDDEAISKRIVDGILQSEVDVMILAHHGADSGFTSGPFLDSVKPRVAVCSSNYDNKFEHPKENIRRLLDERGIPLYTTKTGDVLIVSLDDMPALYRVVNYKAGSEEVSSTKDFRAKFTLPAH